MSRRQQLILDELMWGDASITQLSRAAGWAPLPSVRRDIYALRKMGYDIQTIHYGTRYQDYRLSSFQSARPLQVRLAHTRQPSQGW